MLGIKQELSQTTPQNSSCGDSWAAGQPAQELSRPQRVLSTAGGSRKPKAERRKPILYAGYPILNVAYFATFRVGIPRSEQQTIIREFLS